MIKCYYFSPSLLNSTFEKNQMNGENGYEQVRETIRTIFVASILTGHDVFVIQAKNATQPRIDWYLLTHPPVLISPLGSPMLRITANDHALAQKLVDQRRLDQQTAAKG